jgi:hypothetical protein
MKGNAWHTFVPFKEIKTYHLNRLTFELAYIQVVEETALIEQLLVGTLFDNLPLVDHNHVIGIANGAQAVGDDKARPAFHQPQEGFLDARLGARVYRAGGFIQDQYSRVGENGAGDGQQLTLPLAEIASPL